MAKEIHEAAEGGPVVGRKCPVEGKRLERLRPCRGQGLRLQARAMAFFSAEGIGCPMDYTTQHQR